MDIPLPSEVFPLDRDLGSQMLSVIAIFCTTVMSINFPFFYCGMEKTKFFTIESYHYYYQSSEAFEVAAVYLQTERRKQIIIKTKLNTKQEMKTERNGLEQTKKKAFASDGSERVRGKNYTRNKLSNVYSENSLWSNILFFRQLTTA